MTAENLYAVLLGDKNAVKGGSRKVVDSKPNDRIFLYFSDHGGPGVLGELNLAFKIKRKRKKIRTTNATLMILHKYH